MNRLFNRNGFSLPELLVAFLISNLLLLGFIRTYSLVKNSYRTLNFLSEWQEEQAALTEFIRKKVRGAGYSGCSNGHSLYGKNAVSILNENDVRIPKSIRQFIKPGSRVLYLSQLSSSHASLSDSMRLYEMVTLSQPLKIKKGETLLISDCQHSAFVRVRKTTEDGKRIYFENGIGRLFQRHAIIGKYMETYIYVRQKKSLSGLYLLESGGRSDEISHHVEEMSIQYEHHLKYPLLHLCFHFIKNKYLDINVALRNEIK
jgi:hypothetical protein